MALIIDATTDLSARAMSKVRSLSAPHNAAVDGDTDRGGDAAPPEATATLRIGGQLRQARDTLGLSVDELADRTRIRPFVIECMEADDFSPCGGDFYARGHLRMLARVLGIAPEPLIETYDEVFATSPVGPRAVFDVELATGATGMVRGGAPGANWGGLIAAVLVLVLIWGGEVFRRRRKPRPRRTRADTELLRAGLSGRRQRTHPATAEGPRQADRDRW